jgi:hypothetical protein
MNKKILGTTIAGILLLSVAIAGSGNVSFRVNIQTDTTISIPTLCEDGGSASGILEFQPGITALDDAEAIAIDTCSDNIIGDWNVTNEGNIPIDLAFKLTNGSPAGVAVALLDDNGSPTYGADNHINLTTIDQTPTWADEIDKAETLPLFQRVGANETALGDTTTNDVIVVTSSYDP